MIRTTRIAATAAALALTAGALTGCSIAVDSGTAPAPSTDGSAGTSAQSAPSSTIDIPTPSIPSITVGGSAPSSEPSASASAAGSVHLPPGFPLPPGATVRSSAATVDEIDAKLSVDGGLEAASFWRHHLPTAGYTVTSDEVPGGLGEMRFTGHGCIGDSQLAITDTLVLLQCDLS